MPRRIRLQPYLTERDLHERYRHTCDPVERSRWQFLWLLARGLTATAVARVTGYSAYWIGQIARRYNTAGPDALGDGRRRLHGQRSLLATSDTPLAEPRLPSPIPPEITGAGKRWQHG